MSDAGNAPDERQRLDPEPTPSEPAGTERALAPTPAPTAKPAKPALRWLDAIRLATAKPDSTVVVAPARIPIRRRAMPCPHCDAELPRDLAANPQARCPACELPLTPVEIAGFWRRSGAAIVDTLLLVFTAGPIAWGLDRLVDPLPLAGDARGLDRWLTLASADFGLLLGRAGPFLVMVGLYYLFMVFWNGRTFGQRLLAMRIIDRHGDQPSLAIAGLRSLAQLAGTLGAALGLVWIAFDSEKRAFHDHVAGTYVVRSA
jgi:uncharacterized RDD family membrane protein YckC